MEQDQKEEVAHLQKKISDLQSEHKTEMKKAKQAAENSVFAHFCFLICFFYFFKVTYACIVYRLHNFEKEDILVLELFTEVRICELNFCHRLILALP